MPSIIVIVGVSVADLKSSDEQWEEDLLRVDEDPIFQLMHEMILVDTPLEVEEAPVKEDRGVLPQQLTYRSLSSGGYQILKLPPPNSFRCWYCDLHFDTNPWFLPSEIRSERDNCSVLAAAGGFSGNFCSHICAFGHLNGLPSRDQYAPLLISEIKIRFNISGLRMSFPLPKTERIEFGGHMTEEQYRAELEKRCRV